MIDNAVQLKNSIVKHDRDAWLLELEDAIGNVTAYRITDTRLQKIATEIDTALLQDQADALFKASGHAPAVDSMHTVFADGYLLTTLAANLLCIRFQLAGAAQVQVVLDADVLEKFKKDFPEYKLE